MYSKGHFIHTIRSALTGARREKINTVRIEVTMIFKRTKRTALVDNLMRPKVMHKEWWIDFIQINSKNLEESDK